MTDFLIVSGTLQSHQNAVQHLVRPWEVEHLITRSAPPPAWVVTHRKPFAEQVAEWLKNQFAGDQLSYQSDPSAFDVWYAPGTTLRRRAGDCEDFTLLAVSLLLAGGIPAWVAVGTVPGGGHAWVEGKDEQGGFLIEATSGDLFRYRPNNYQLLWHVEPDFSLLRAA